MRQKEKRVGVFIGKFLPPHIGHINQITECAKQCDKLFVIIADSDARSKNICKESNIKTIYPKTRYFWFKKYFKENKNIYVKFINQGMLEAYPENLNNWKKTLSKITKHNKLIWFVDKNFLAISKQTFPEIEFVGFDRTKIDISSKKIRENFKKLSSYLPKGFSIK